MDIYFVTLDDALKLHDLLISKFGGLTGLRDRGLLDSALAQAQATAFGRYLHGDICEMAAAYCFHIIKNHSFLDGNKRTGLLVALMFLEKNGFQLCVENDALYAMTIHIAMSKLSKKNIAEFFRKNVVPISQN